MIYFDSKITMGDVSKVCDMLEGILVPDKRGNLVVTLRAAEKLNKPISTDTPRARISTVTGSWHVQCPDCGKWIRADSSEGIVSLMCEYCGKLFSAVERSYTKGRWIDPQDLTEDGWLKSDPHPDSK